MNRRAILLCLLVGTVACDPEVEPPTVGAVTRRVRLFDHRGAAPDDSATAAPTVLTVPFERVTTHGQGPSGVARVALPWPATPGASSGDVHLQGAAQQVLEAAGAAPLELHLVPHHWTVQGESMEREDREGAEAPRALAARIALPPGSSLSTPMPPLVEGARAVVTLRGQGGAGTVLVRFGENDPMESPATNEWTRVTLDLPASREPTRLQIASADQNPADSRLVVKLLEIQAGAHDAVVFRGAAERVESLRRAMEQPDSRLQYPALAPPTRLVLDPSNAFGEAAGRRWFPVLLHAGVVRVLTQNDIAVSLDGAVADVDGAFRVDEPGLHRLEVAASAEGLMALFQPESARRSRRTRDLLPEPLFDQGTGWPLQRIDVAGERRVACVLTSPDVLTFDVPDGAPRLLRLGLAELGSLGPTDGAAPLTLRLLDREGRELHREVPPALGPDGWLDWEILLPDLTVARLELQTAGEAFSIDAAGTPHEHHLAVSCPVLVDPDERPGGILVYLVDTLRADHMQVMGYERDTTPNLVRRQSEFVVFENAYSACSWTRPSTASLLTGLHPSFHGAHGQNVLASEVLTLAEQLHALGYATGAVVTNPNVSGPTLGFEEGFEEFHAAFAAEQHPDDLFLTSSSYFQPWLVDWLQRHQHQPFFLYVHSIDPHSPYTPPEDEWRRYDPDYDGRIDGLHQGPGAFEHFPDPTAADVAHVVALYDAEIRQNDATIAELWATLQDLGLWDDTGFLLTSDHGEEFREHGGWTHGLRAYEEQLHVPLMIKPAARWRLAPRRVAHRTQLTDVAPTLLDLIGVDPAGRFTGDSVANVLRGVDSEQPGRPLYFDELPELHSLYHGDMKLIVYEGEPPRRMLFDVSEDPAEFIDLSGGNAKRIDSLEGNLRQFYQRFHDRGFTEIRAGARPAIMDEETINRLMGIGYFR